MVSGKEGTKGCCQGDCGQHAKAFILPSQIRNTGAYPRALQDAVGVAAMAGPGACEVGFLKCQRDRVRKQDARSFFPFLILSQVRLLGTCCIPFPHGLLLVQRPPSSPVAH